ncbi:hypothetical protein ZTR_09806 [Talaromyces verruculosus]|nr:hypothetical protein ZTR_09806 [Talaromyces verruculosus]
MRQEAPWKTFHEWTPKYDPVTSFKVGSRTVIVLGTREVTKDLLVKRNLRYSMRPSLQMAVLELDIAGRATTAITLGIMVMTATLHPEEMEVVYNEMDRVVGNCRMPNAADIENLTQLQAFIKESMRFRSIAPLGFPHATTQEDEHMGFRIPPDAIIVPNHVPNQWGLNMDSTVFQTPDSFLPERWILNPDLPEPSLFGFGKRSCPAKDVAYRSMLIAMASLVWAFHFEAKEGFSDAPDMATSIFFIPQTSNIGVSYRTPHHQAIVEREWMATDPDVSLLLDNIGKQLGKSQV